MFQRITNWVDRHIEIGARLIASAGFLPLGVIGLVSVEGDSGSPLDAYPVVSLIALALGIVWAAFIFWRLARFEYLRWRRELPGKDR